MLQGDERREAELQVNHSPGIQGSQSEIESLIIYHPTTETHVLSQLERRLCLPMFLLFSLTSMGSIKNKTAETAHDEIRVLIFLNIQLALAKHNSSNKDMTHESVLSEPVKGIHQVSEKQHTFFNFNEATMI